MTEKLMKPQEAAQLLGITYRQMLVLISSGEIETIPVGKRRMVTDLAIERWQHRALSTPESKVPKVKEKKKAPSMRELMAREAALKGPIPRRRYGNAV